MTTRTALTSYLKRRRQPVAFKEIVDGLSPAGVTNQRSIAACLFNGKVRSEYVKDEDTGLWEYNREFKKK